VLYGFLILQHCRRELLWLGVTARPSADWIARQLTEAYDAVAGLEDILPKPRASDRGH
jgi:hypothetical protein